MYFGPKSNICWQTIPHFPDSLSDANIVFCNPFLDSPFWQASPSVFFCFCVVCGGRTPKQKNPFEWRWSKMLVAWLFQDGQYSSSHAFFFKTLYVFLTIFIFLHVKEFWRFWGIDTQNFKCKQHFSGANDTHMVLGMVWGDHTIAGGPAEKQHGNTYLLDCPLSQY